MNSFVPVSIGSRLLAGLTVLCLARAVLAGPAATPPGFSTFAEVGREAAATLGAGALEAAFGPGQLVSLTPYFDPAGNVSVYAVEVRVAADNNPATALVSAWRDAPPVVMLWRGLPQHRDPTSLERARDAVASTLGLAVTKPRAVLWLDAFDVWAQFVETDPITGSPICCELNTGALATPAALAARWQERSSAETSPIPIGLAATRGQSDPPAFGPWAAEHGRDVAALWNDAEAYLAARTSGNLFQDPALPLADLDARAVAGPLPPPTLAVTYPAAAGTTLCRGQVYAIRWSAPPNPLPTLTIELCRDVFPPRLIAAEVPASALGHPWTVPADLLTGAGYRIRLTASNAPAAPVLSQNPFAVVEPTVNAASKGADVNLAPAILVASDPEVAAAATPSARQPSDSRTAVPSATTATANSAGPRTTRAALCGRPSPPTNLTATRDDVQAHRYDVYLSWKGSSGATSYRVYRGTSVNDRTEWARDLKGTSYSDLRANYGVVYTYWIVACNTSGSSDYSSPAEGSCLGAYVATPTGLKASTTKTDRISLTWYPVSNATKYWVYRSTSNSKPKTPIATVKYYAYYDDMTVPKGKYYYWVRADNGLGISLFSSSVQGERK
jgi:hypothetical protein